MKDMLTDQSLFSGLGDILFVFEMCALKTSNESVLEGMNSIVSAHADSVRGAAAETYEAEAYLHWNGPPLHKADSVITGALNSYFGGSSWHFSHVSPSSVFSPYVYKSKVLRRLMEDGGRLPFLNDN
eukprot:GHVU01031220.1.p1 GENE.GHVU01031220.1~~GHVU01031220.1.p1  ORF type:complete len:127 (-),score=5.37 GHVU01031220.1:251-631(-)